MATTRKAIRAIESGNADPELLTSLLVSKSEPEASVAFSVLRFTLTDDELVQLANLREVLHLLPTGPFRTGECLDLLQRVANYEYTGYSYRRVFESDGGRVFGVEFLGGEHDCRGIVVHTPKARIPVTRGDCATVNEALLPVLMRHTMLLDAMLEALGLLGSQLSPRIYLTPDDFLAEHHPLTLRETLGGSL